MTTRIDKILSNLSSLDKYIKKENKNETDTLETFSLTDS